MRDDSLSSSKVESFPSSSLPPPLPPLLLLLLLLLLLPQSLSPSPPFCGGERDDTCCLASLSRAVVASSIPPVIPSSASTASVRGSLPSLPSSAFSRRADMLAVDFTLTMLAPEIEPPPRPSPPRYWPPVLVRFRRDSRSTQLLDFLTDDLGLLGPIGGRPLGLLLGFPRTAVSEALEAILCLIDVATRFRSCCGRTGDRGAPLPPPIPLRARPRPGACTASYGSSTSMSRKSP